MRLFSTPTFCTLDDLLLTQTQTLYDIEQRLCRSLRSLADAVYSKRLSTALSEYRRESERQLARLEVLFQLLGITAGTETCEAIKALIAEGDEILRAEGELEVKDAAIIALVQRIAHYQMAAYGSARTITRQLGFDQIDVLLKDSLEEESAALEEFTEIAETSVNLALVRA
jgi:ferritin-like metal-binding protein YciE